MFNLDLTMQQQLLLAGITVVLAPFVGAILTGIDRRITARLQSRMGPPILQPMYDAMKLLSKGGVASHRLQIVVVWVNLLSMVICLLMMLLGQDMLVMLFVLALGSISLIIGGFSVRSPYSQLGSQREIMQMLAYEPLLIFLAVAVYLKTGTFMVSAVASQPEPLLYSMPLFVATMIIVMGIKLRKSPFDVAASHHAHQELVRGLMTEYSGTTLALIEISHWYELILLLTFLMMLWTSPWWAGVVLALLCYFAVILIDNITARMTWNWTVKIGWHLGVPLSLANLILLYLIRR